MMLESGQWLGRGSLLAEGQSRGLPLACHLLIERDADGVTLTGGWQAEGEAEQGIAIRLASNDVGTYTLNARFGARRLDGTAKSQPSGARHTVRSVGPGTTARERGEHVRRGGWAYRERASEYCRSAGGMV